MTCKAPISFPFTTKVSYQTLVSRMVDGRSFRRPINWRRHREFTVFYTLLTQGEFEELRATLTLAAGGAGVFQMSLPDEIQPVNVQFVGNTLNYTIGRGMLYGLSFRVRESFA